MSRYPERGSAAALNFGAALAASSLAIGGHAQHHQYHPNLVKKPERNELIVDHLAQVAMLSKNIEIIISNERKESKKPTHNSTSSSQHHYGVKKHYIMRLVLPELAQRIAGCESRGEPEAQADYHAQNAYSTASGAFQDLDTTWKDLGGYPHAKDAPEKLQNEFNLNMLNHDGTSPWYSSQTCWANATYRPLPAPHHDTTYHFAMHYEAIPLASSRT